MKKTIKGYVVLIPIATVIATLDQWTKSIVRRQLELGEIWSPWEWLTPYTRVVHWYNTGVAFGMFQDKNLLFSLLSLTISVFIFIFYPKLTEDDWLLKIALGLQLGGSIGNLIDRLTIGHVTDFISVGSFPVFNVADASVTIGAAVMILGLWIQERREAMKKDSLDQNHHSSEKAA